MRRFVFFVFFVFCLSGVLAADVAYVVKDGAEMNVVSGVEALGFSYDVVDDSEISSTDFGETIITRTSEGVDQREIF